MSLLAEIIEEASTDDDVARLLRRCMVLAHNLNSVELAAWTRAELNGYGADVELPSYRKLPCQSKGQFVGPYNAWQGTFEIALSSLPENSRKNFESVAAREPIAHFESLISRTKAKGGLMVPWPTDAARRYGPKGFEKGTVCLHAWNEISPASVVAMVDQVKSRVLEFALAISKDFPELRGSDELNQASVSKETQVNQTFHTTIMGSVGNLAAGSTNVKQTSDLVVEFGQWETLRKALSQQGVQTAELDTLQAALAEDQAAGEIGIGSRVQGWLGNMVAMAAAGVGAVGTNAIGSAIAPLIAKYLGIAG